ncbi:hypothetical protein DFQ27_008103 [Actinomortierella ambigua]|uniref:U1 small nuclear ribonucleoprotein C n=1 Tax=Actinomortierella ambigua TaxID=1343610 RepID=A0A9P6TZ83_9FUNG|nr:hypothetical protein DFQ27_008103 [Actinomortierella ambigua]
MHWHLDSHHNYCDIFLTHDSSSVRKAHNAGRNHLLNVKTYYSELSQDTTQSVIDTIAKAYANSGGATLPPQYSGYPQFPGSGSNSFHPYARPASGFPPAPHGLPLRPPVGSSAAGGSGDAPLPPRPPMMMRPPFGPPGAPGAPPPPPGFPMPPPGAPFQPPPFPPGQFPPPPGAGFPPGGLPPPPPGFRPPFPGPPPGMPPMPLPPGMPLPVGALPPAQQDRKRKADE